MTAAWLGVLSSRRGRGGVFRFPTLCSQTTLQVLSSSLSDGPAVIKASAPVDDEESNLVPRIRSGDEAAFELLYLAHHDELWRFAYAHVRSRDVAEELVQDVFLAVWGTRATWEVNTRVRAWLYASVRHLALNYLRHERVVTRTTGANARAPGGGAWEGGSPASVAIGQTSGSARVDATTMGTPPMDPQLALEAEEIDQAVVHAIAELPERRRIAMMLRWKHDMSSLEIARVLGTTPEAVRTLLSRARADLVPLLEHARH
jgi:RNA polymerase sigma-70 factor (ECF subfamily)